MSSQSTRSSPKAREGNSKSDGPSSPTFAIGLSMSGAISAGAYTAGVFDFLILALNEWAKVRKAREQQPVLTVMTGASAGGVTAALGTIALAHGLTPTAYRTQWGATIDCVLPDLYEAWVVKPDMLPPAPGRPGLLTGEDLEASPAIRSLLNSTVLDDICRDALRPVRQVSTGLPFVSAPLDLYLTISNLAGIPYRVTSANGYPYRMVNHGDRVHYVVSDLGSGPDLTSPWARGDTVSLGGPLSVGGLISPTPAWQRFGIGALATSAFPAGLSPRLVEAMSDDYNGIAAQGDVRQWPAPLSPGATIEPGPPDVWPPVIRHLSFVSVDGGMIDNDPFEYARYALSGDRQATTEIAEERRPAQADRAVIMISPFPEGETPGDLRATTKALTLLGNLSGLLPTLIAQARFKLTELAAAVDDDVASRWLIAPRRDDSGTVSSRFLACGLLGGFGGFLDRGFREHDFQLGQHNCQRFLRNWFALPPENAAVAGNREHVVAAERGARRADHRHIIPLVGAAAVEIPQPTAWPAIGAAKVDALVEAAGHRGFELLVHLCPCAIGRVLIRWLSLPILWPLWRLWISRGLKADLISTLKAREQFKNG